jgi:hypothetical protein
MKTLRQKITSEVAYFANVAESAMLATSCRIFSSSLAFGRQPPTASSSKYLSLSGFGSCRKDRSP